MLQVVHFADVHLGVENYGRIDPGTGLSTRLIDFLKSVDYIVETALEKQADLVIFAGDAYKTRDPSPTYQREFARRIRRLSSAGLPTVLVAGNHDMPNAVGRAHTMEIFGTLEVENVHVARSPGVLEIETRHGLVQVGVLPWIVRSGLLSYQEYKNKSLQDVNRILLARVESILNGEGGLVSALKPNVPHILVAHGSVQGAVYGSERTVMLGHDLTWPLSLFKNEHWDYVALGHIHRHQALEDDQFPPVVYPGSIERIDFGEEKQDKGFVIAQVGRNECTWAFHKLDARPFVTVRVEADGQDPTAQVIDAIDHAPVRDAVVRVMIQTTPERNLLINEKQIERALGDAFYIASMTRNVTRSERVRLGNQQDIAGLTPIQVLERYLQVKQTPPERIERLMRYAEMLSTTVTE